MASPRESNASSRPVLPSADARESKASYGALSLRDAYHTLSSQSSMPGNHYNPLSLSPGAGAGAPVSARSASAPYVPITVARPYTPLGASPPRNYSPLNVSPRGQPKQFQ
jgi:hypothetical protein